MRTALSIAALIAACLPGPCNAFGDYIRAQYSLWGGVVKATGAKAN